MRILIGMVLGAALVVLVAHTHDHHPELIGAGDKPMVDWAVVDANVTALEARIADVWAKTKG